MRKPFAKSLSELLPNVLKPALAEHGVATSQLITRWPDIAGEELSAFTRPLRLNWPRVPEGAPKTGATLVLLVEPAFALDVQHAVPLILERINALYGWRAVEKLALRQGQVKEKKAIENQIVINRPGPCVTGIEDSSLQTALQKLGQAIANKSND